MRRPRPGGDKRQLWPGTQILYSVHTAQEPNDCFPQERSVKRLKFVAHERLLTAKSGRSIQGFFDFRKYRLCFGNCGFNLNDQMTLEATSNFNQ